MHIEELSVDDLKPYFRNTKKHPESQVDKLAKMIKEFGFSVPVIVDANNEIIAGHCRVLAAKKLGMSEVPCVRKSDLSPAQVKAMRIADNKISESEWDMEFLNEELDWLNDLGFDLELTGWGELPVFEFRAPNEDEQSDDEQRIFALKVTLNNEEEQQQLFDELKERGYKVKV